MEVRALLGERFAGSLLSLPPAPGHRRSGVVLPMTAILLPPPLLPENIRDRGCVLRRTPRRPTPVRPSGVRPAFPVPSALLGGSLWNTFPQASLIKLEKLESLVFNSVLVTAFNADYAHVL